MASLTSSSSFVFQAGQMKIFVTLGDWKKSRELFQCQVFFSILDLTKGFIWKTCHDFLNPGWNAWRFWLLDWLSGLLKRCVRSTRTTSNNIFFGVTNPCRFVRLVMFCRFYHGICGNMCGHMYHFPTAMKTYIYQQWMHASISKYCEQFLPNRAWKNIWLVGRFRDGIRIDRIVTANSHGPVTNRTTHPEKKQQIQSHL